jgi:hypothetical protein
MMAQAELGAVHRKVETLPIGGAALAAAGVGQIGDAGHRAYLLTIKKSAKPPLFSEQFQISHATPKTSPTQGFRCKKHMRRFIIYHRREGDRWRQLQPGIDARACKRCRPNRNPLHA